MSPVRENDMWYTYILRSRKDKRWYTGCTFDLKKRLKQHNKNLVSSTKNRGLFDLIYYEPYLNKKTLLLEKNI